MLKARMGTHLSIPGICASLCLRVMALCSFFAPFSFSVGFSLMVRMHGCAQLSEKWQAAGPDVLQQQERLFRENNPCCSSLPSFGSFMSLYGIATEQVQSLLISVSKHLNLDEQTREMLLHGVVDATASDDRLLVAQKDTGKQSNSNNGNTTNSSSSTNMEPGN